MRFTVLTPPFRRLSRPAVGRSPFTHSTALLVALAVLPAPAPGQDGVARTVHNLSAGGPGAVRAVSEQQICVFCHAPHNTAGLRPLWNRELPAASYKIYESTTLDARPEQPTGSSKLCLSCHDGTIALGSVLSRDDHIRMRGGSFMPAGLTNLGTDLSDDHPVSFHYTGGLAAADHQLASPGSLPAEIRLDAGGQMQCTSCHDPHHNRFGDFLLMDSAFGALCTACHIMTGWNSSTHRTSAAAVTGGRSTAWPHTTVAENACRSCHRMHTAGGPQRLLINEQDEDNCLNCHDGQVARTDIRAELDKQSAHDPRRYQDVHDPAETTALSRPHVECSDCHNPHAVAGGPARSAGLSIGPTMRAVRGLTVSGNEIDEARHEYEVCLRCHAGSDVSRRAPIGRQSQTSNYRLKFSPGNPSYHPVVLPAPNRDTVSLVPHLASGALIRCTDCHNNDAGPQAGGQGPDGPHGSRHDYLLERNYTTFDDTVESEYEYALCYKCHQRSSILSDQSFPLHRLHIVDQRTPCSACHDPHGVSRVQSFQSDHTHLINFDTRIVRPDPATRTIRFRDTGRFAGSCTLTCHGVTHSAWPYSQQGFPVR